MKKLIWHPDGYKILNSLNINSTYQLTKKFTSDPLYDIYGVLNRETYRHYLQFYQI